MWCMIQVLSWFPSVLTFPITFPTNKEFKSTTKEFTISDMVNFILFLALDGNRIRGRWQEPVDFVPFICRETIDVKSVMYFQSRWQGKLIINMGNDLLDLKRAKLFRSEFR